MEGHRRVGEPSHPLFGRSEALGQIDRLLEQARAGSGGGLLLVGPGGIGKTELLRAGTGRARGWRIARGRALPDDVPAPFSLLRDLIGSFGSETDPAAEDERPPALSLPGLLGPVDRRPGRPEASPPNAPLPGPPDAELERILAPLGRTSVEGLGAIRHRMYARLIEYFLRLARDCPLLLALDDLHFADPSSLHFVEQLAPDLPGAQVAVLATIGVGAEIPARSREVLERITRSPSFGSVSLRPLTVSELAEFVSWIAGGATLPPDDVQRWHAETNGNPLLVEQLASSAARSGRSGMPSGSGAPAGLVDGLLAQTRQLPEADQRVLTYAAVLGREFDFPRLAAVIGLGEERVTESLDRLVRAGVLRERGGEVYEFASEAVRGGVYAELTETRRRILHRKVASALEAQGGASDFELSRLFYLGRVDDKAVEYNVRAAGAATRASAFDTAASHLARALESERRRPDRDRRREVRLLTEEGRLIGETGDSRRAEELLEEAVALARAGSVGSVDLGRAVLALAWARAERAEFGSAEALASEALSLLDAAASARDRLSAHRILGTAYWRLGEFARAEEHQRAALEIAEREGSPLELGHSLVDVANVLSREPSRTEEALALYGRAADLFASADEQAARARALMNRAALEYTAGRVEDAFREIAVALDVAERSRTPVWICYCLINLAVWETDRRAVDAARDAADRASALAEAIGDPLAQLEIAIARGRIAELVGAYDEAEARLQEALTAGRTRQMPAEAAEALFRLAQLSNRRGDRDSARQRLTEAKEGHLVEFRPDLEPRIRELETEIGSG
jgi:tetratricopeptide (TPR) repeat protein